MTVHFKDNSEAFRRALHEATADQVVAMPDLFTADFLTRYTQFKSCEEMFQYLLTTNDVHHPKDLTHEQMDAMATARTSFSSWRTMMGMAHGERIKARLRSRLSGL